MIAQTPAQVAYQALQDNPQARLCDVRTDLEWQRVGVPALPEPLAPPVFVSWQTAPAMQHNPRFLQDLAASGLSPDHHVYFICRSGARSNAAAEAASAAGYNHVYNVAEGFEGHPGMPGWWAQGLPAGRQD